MICCCTFLRLVAPVRCRAGLWPLLELTLAYSALINIRVLRDVKRCSRSTQLQELELKERSILVKQRPDRPPQPRVATLSGKLAEDQSSSPSPNPGTPILRSLPASQQNSQQQLLWPMSPGGHDAGPGLPAAPGEAAAAGPAEMETARAREMADRERELEADMERERERARLRSEVVADTLAMSLRYFVLDPCGKASPLCIMSRSHAGADATIRVSASVCLTGAKTARLTRPAPRCAVAARRSQAKSGRNKTPRRPLKLSRHLGHLHCMSLPPHSSLPTQT